MSESLLTCAGDDDVHLSDDLVQLHQPEPVHAGRRRNKEAMFDPDGSLVMLWPDYSIAFASVDAVVMFYI